MGVKTNMIEYHAIWKNLSRVIVADSHIPPSHLRTVETFAAAHGLTVVVKTAQLNSLELATLLARGYIMGNDALHVFDFPIPELT